MYTIPVFLRVCRGSLRILHSAPCVALRHSEGAARAVAHGDGAAWSVRRPSQRAHAPLEFTIVLICAWGAGRRQNRLRMSGWSCSCM